MNDFDSLMTQLDVPMVVVTTTNDQEQAGCLVGFHAQSSIEPRSLSVWLSKANHTFRVATMAEAFVVHFLTEDDIDLATLFGTASGDDIDKFDRCRWHEGPHGVPVLDDCANHVVGRKVALLDTAVDHVCLVLDPVDTVYGGEFRPLHLSDVSHLRAGHEAEERPAPSSTRADEDG